ncbi:MAG TPA: RNA polymerase sigma-70 factor [Longimicrobiaceae bacterium]|nr:RNA polymerase sigma-70 factor [Longimicrobiaceae bacterium]
MTREVVAPDFPEVFEAYRPLMLSIAYRMLGSVADAEDVVQDAYVRCHATAPEAIRSPRAFLTTVVTRLCLNQLESARARRETYIGPWLPEPLATEGRDPASLPALSPVAGQRAEAHESISLAFLVLLEQLTPAERAVFLLREVFDYEYAEIAAILGKEEAACRQLLSRARKHVTERRPRFSPSPEHHRRLLQQFMLVVSGGELEGLVQLLSEDVTMWVDGGGKVRGAATRVLHGRMATAQFLLASTRFLPRDARAEIAEVNGQPAMVLRVGRRAELLIALGSESDRVREIRVIANPEKLRWV